MTLTSKVVLVYLFFTLFLSESEFMTRNLTQVSSEIISAEYFLNLLECENCAVVSCHHQVSSVNVTRVVYVRGRELPGFTQRNVSLALTHGSVPINLAVTSLQYPSPKKGTRVKSACAQCS